MQLMQASERLDRDEAARFGESRAERGQATVEFALVLVALVSVVWALLSLCLLVRDQVLVTHASREAARTYAVTRSLDAATQAARDRSGLGSDLVVTVEPQPENLARITVSLGIGARIPIAGRVRPGLQLQSSLITYVEPG
jgi:Flp pilus assembly protein TadG